YLASLRSSAMMRLPKAPSVQHEVRAADRDGVAADRQFPRLRGGQDAGLVCGLQVHGRQAFAAAVAVGGEAGEAEFEVDDGRAVFHSEGPFEDRAPALRKCGRIGRLNI